MKRFIPYLLGAVLGCLLGKLYCLEWLPALITGVLYLPVLASYAVQAEKRRRYSRSFHALISYMEQMIYLFRRRPKIAAALREVRETAEKELQPMLTDMLAELEQDAGEGAYQRCFAVMEKSFPCRELQQLHHFFIKIEEIGGEYAGGLDLLLSQTRSWSEEETLYQKELDRIRQKVGLCVGLSLLIGCVSMRLIPDAFSIVGLPVYQWLTTAALAGFGAVFFFSQKNFTRSWIAEDKHLTEAETEQLRSHLVRKPMTKRYYAELFAAYCVLAAAVCVGSAPAAVCGVFLCVWQALKPLRQRRNALKRLRREAAEVFPDWLRELSVHLQTQTVMAALSDVQRDARPLMKSYLRELLHAIDEDPVHIEPYRAFMAELELPEVRDAMVLLYSLNGLGRHSAEEQLNALTERNMQLYRRGEQLRREDAAAFQGLTVAVPMGITVIKLIVDMILTVMRFLSSVG